MTETPRPLPTPDRMAEAHARHLALLSDIAGRHGALGADALRLVALRLVTARPSPDLWSDMLDMQRAFWKRMEQIGEQWQEGLKDLGEQAAQLRSANTLSKLIEQDCNLANQFGALLTAQATAVATLVESTQVGFGYWLKEKLDELPDGPPPAGGAAPQPGTLALAAAASA
ncbi:hypothetical protein NON00_23390, partial [Roseomonas sp. GC11]|uniref:hypothetical protein n=1 Tax=Roseomonas sp. GC11 TaxID=2950546 RepID=UPI00210AEFC6